MPITIDWNNSYCLGNNRAFRVSIDCSRHPPLRELKLRRYIRREMIACKGLSASRTFRGNFMCAIYGGHAGADRRTGQARELKAHFFKKMCIFIQRQPYSRQFRVFQFFMVQFFLNARISYLLTVFSYLGHNSMKKRQAT